MHYSEELLHFLWKFRLFSQQRLFLVSGEPVEIIFPGIHNKHAGPDFEEAKIRISETVWAGNVEMHLRSSDWNQHGHTSDKAYNNVILHVVLHHDAPVFRNDGTEIPVLVLNGLIPGNIEANYRDLMENLSWIPCEKKIAAIDEFHIQSWLSRVLVERLEEKSQMLEKLLKEYKGSWDNAFYVMLARNFGFKTNGLPFELLARSLPQTILAKHKNNLMQLEALIFGQAGFLEADLDDEYHKRLKSEYLFLKKKYQLTPLEAFLWKFLRLRPSNFPTIRLAQFAALIAKSNHLFSKIIEIEDVKVLKTCFAAIHASSYWDTHYRFGKEGRARSGMGAESVDNILLNTVVLFIFYYGKCSGKQNFVSRAIALLESLAPENNNITRGFKKIGVAGSDAAASQAMLQLKKSYCDTRKCLNCGIGTKLLNQN